MPNFSAYLELPEVFLKMYVPQDILTYFGLSSNLGINIFKMFQMELGA
jgi:hypothetical protein